MELDGITFQSGGMKDLRILPVTTLPTGISEGTLVNHNGEWKRFTGVADTWERTIAAAAYTGASLTYTFHNPTPSTSDRFSEGGVAISGDYAIVGTYRDDTGAGDAGSAYIYNVTTGALVHALNNPTPGNGDMFGYSVSISDNYAIVGAYYDNTGAGNAGSAYIYDVTTGALVHTLNNPAPAQNDRFGWTVGISGNYAVVGAYADDAGTTDTGSAYIYNVTTGTLVHTLNNPTPASSDYFGYSVSISDNYAIVGAHRDDTGATDAGSAYIYNVTTGTLVHTLNNPTPATSDYFGWSVSISGDYAIVGAYRDNTGATNAGSAYIYDVTTGTLVHTLNNPTPANSDHFGYSVSISGDYAIVGAYLDDTTGADQGSAYIYNVTTGELVTTIANPNSVASTSDHFGWSVGIDNGTVMVGSRLEDYVAGDSGTAYVFTLT